MSAKTLNEEQLWHCHLFFNNTNLSGLTIASYVSETWALTAIDKKKRLVFEMECLRSILGAPKLNKIRDIEIRRTTATAKTIVDVKR